MKVIDYYTKDVIKEDMTFEECEKFILDQIPEIGGRRFFRVIEDPKGPAYDVGRYILQIVDDQAKELS